MKFIGTTIGIEKLQNLWAQHIDNEMRTMVIAEIDCT